VPAAGSASAGISVVANGFDKDSPWWLLKYRNTGNVTIANPAVLGEFRAGGAKKSVRFPATVYSIPPGEDIWIRAVPGLNTAAEAAFTVEQPKPAGHYTTAYAKMAVLDFEWAPTSGKYSKIVGKVRNPLKVKAEAVHLFAVGYDATGNVCAFVDGYVRGTNLAAGAVGEFWLYAGVWQNSMPRRWELTGWARVGK
jgi:hypothetical protein